MERAVSFDSVRPNTDILNGWMVGGSSSSLWVYPWVTLSRNRQESSTVQGLLYFLSLPLQMNYKITKTLEAEFASSSLCMCVLDAQSCDPIDCSPPGSSVHGISQGRMLEWVAISSSRGSSWLRDQTQVFCVGRQILYHWATWEDTEPPGKPLNNLSYHLLNIFCLPNRTLNVFHRYSHPVKSSAK